MKLLFSALVSAALIMGCGSDTTDTDAGTPDAGATDTAPTPLTFTNNITVNDFVTESPIEGAKLCTNLEGAECQMTDADGKTTFTGEVLPGDRVELRGEKEGYFSFLVEGVIRDDAVSGAADNTWVMGDLTTLETLAGSIDVTIDTAKGALSVGVVGPVDAEGNNTTIVGAKVSIDLGTGAGPKYVNPVADFGDGAFGPDEDGTTALGLASFWNVDLGTAHITVTAEGHDCVPGATGLPSETATVASTIVAGHISYVAVRCTPSN